MKITEEEIKALNPCTSGWGWYLKNQEDDLLKLLLNANKNNPSDARWLFTTLMNKKQCIEIAIFSAKEVLHIFEGKYPEDKRPRKAIEAAENYLQDPSEENKKAAADAAAAAEASAASYAASAAEAAASAYAAAAYAAADAASAAEASAAEASAASAYAAADAADAASYADAAAYAAEAKLKLQEKTIKEAVKIMEGSK
jgi:hypothetical protein